MFLWIRSDEFLLTLSVLNEEDKLESNVKHGCFLTLDLDNVPTLHMLL